MNFINDPDKIVFDSLEALIATNENLNRLDGYPSIKVVVDQAHIDAGKTKVAVISGASDCSAGLWGSRHIGSDSTHPCRCLSTVAIQPAPPR
jgi:hypothetical protein